MIALVSSRTSSYRWSARWRSRAAMRACQTVAIKAPTSRQSEIAPIANGARWRAIVRRRRYGIVGSRAITGLASRNRVSSSSSSRAELYRRVRSLAIAVETIASMSPLSCFAS